MDEVGFELSASRRVRAVAPKGASIKAQGALPNDVHITAVACIGVADAPIPPLLLYPGDNLLQEWINVADPSPDCTATVTASGYSNQYMTTWWLEKVFDPYSKDRAQGSRQLLILDGCKVHHSYRLYRACEDRDINLLYLPHNLSAVFQPLDVNFNNTLKHYYEQQVRDFQHDLGSSRASKGHFYRWFQLAWRRTAVTHQITAAWRESGLHPLSQTIMRAFTPPPPTYIDERVLQTPHSAAQGKALERAVRQENIGVEEAFYKMSKAFDVSDAKCTVLSREEEKRKAAEEVDKAT